MDKIYLNDNKLGNNSENETYIFIDISNIYIGFYNYIIHNHKKYKICNPKMNYNTLFTILEKENKIKKKVIIGSKYKENTKKYKKEEKQKKIFNKLGYESYFLDRINGKEKGVDELLHNRIMEILLYEIPGTLIIASGDGNSSDFTDNSFYKLCIHALKKGWKVIIVSWKYQLNKNYIVGPELCNLLRNFDMKNNFKILYLDKHIENLIL